MIYDESFGKIKDEKFSFKLPKGAKKEAKKPAQESNKFKSLICSQASGGAWGGNQPQPAQSNAWAGNQTAKPAEDNSSWGGNQNAKPAEDNPWGAPPVTCNLFNTIS